MDLPIHFRSPSSSELPLHPPLLAHSILATFSLCCGISQTPISTHSTLLHDTDVGCIYVIHRFQSLLVREPSSSSALAPIFPIPDSWHCQFQYRYICVLWRVFLRQMKVRIYCHESSRDSYIYESLSSCVNWQGSSDDPKAAYPSAAHCRRGLPQHHTYGCNYR